MASGYGELREGVAKEGKQGSSLSVKRVGRRDDVVWRRIQDVLA